jgi:hypothetical protein
LESAPGGFVFNPRASRAFSDHEEHYALPAQAFCRIEKSLKIVGEAHVSRIGDNEGSLEAELAAERIVGAVEGDDGRGEIRDDSDILVSDAACCEA